LLGVVNTVLTESVMEATDVPRSVASSAYSGVRFLGGAAAPPLAALLWHAYGPTVPYVCAAVSVFIATGILLLGRRALAAADGREPTASDEATAIVVGDAA